MDIENDGKAVKLRMASRYSRSSRLGPRQRVSRRKANGVGCKRLTNVSSFY